jgi:ABC-type proline/glycine betaine transport system ATPase subunit
VESIMTEGTHPAVRFVEVSRHYGAVRAVDGVSFDIADGEFFSLLGPSGSGKTTCLRLIAGFEQAHSGAVLIHGRDMAGVPPYERDVNTVFQDYALFPHMSVADNVAVVPRLERWSPAQAHARVQELLALVGLPPDRCASRWPDELSGGQRQRVGVARALAVDPPVLLMDEPFGALDPITRAELQQETARLQDRMRKTILLVTHDVDEALVLSDRICVIENGRLQACVAAEAFDDADDPVIAALRNSRVRGRAR